jgi:hypothetical protein
MKEIKLFFKNYVMDFYRMLESSGNDIGKTFPQSQTAIHKVNIEDIKHIWNQKPYTLLADDVVVPEPILHPKAILTDLVSTVTISLGLLVSERLKLIIEKLSSPSDIQFISINLHSKKTQHKYWVLRPLKFDMALIRYDASEIYKDSTLLGPFEKMHIKSFQEYLDALKIIEKNFSHSREGLEITTLRFQEGISKNFLQIENVKGGIGYFVSDNLKKQIESAGCTGISFEKVGF